MSRVPLVTREHSHRFERDEHDHYVEAEWVSERLFYEENFGGRGALIVDPACGWQRIAVSAMNAGYKVRSSDIVDRRRIDLDEIPFQKLDFLALHPEKIYSWWRAGTDDEIAQRRQQTSIVCNPPFNLVEEFAARALALATYKVAFVFPVRRLPAAWPWLVTSGLSRLLFITPRPSMPTGSYILSGKKVGGGKQDFCWLIWTKGYRGQPAVGWLHRDRKAIK